MGYSRRANVRIEQVNGEVLVLDDENGYIHQLNETASFVWHQCDDNASIEEIAQRLAESFDVDVAQAFTDVANLIERFRQLELLGD